MSHCASAETKNLTLSMKFSKSKMKQKFKTKKKVMRKKEKEKFKNPQEMMAFEMQKEKKEMEKLEKEIHNQRVKQLRADNLKEDMEIKKLEKHLKMRTGKSKAFAFDGLDYLLDVCDRTLSKNALNEMMENSDSEFESDLEDIIGENVKKKKVKRKKKQQQEKEEDPIYEDEAIDESFEEEEEEELSDYSEPEQTRKKRKIETLSETDKKTVEDTKGKPKHWEDVYGRMRDEKGNIIETYMPPHLRKKTQKTESEKQVRLKKQLKGFLNRLAESNMAFISNQIEQLYMCNSRNDMNETLCTLFSESLFGSVATPEKLIMEHAMLISVLHANIGSEIGANFLQFAVTEFNKLMHGVLHVEDKQINNVLMFIMQLYNFQVFNVKLMFDILNELVKKLKEKQIELLLLTFRTVGFNLRKDDPLALKAFIIKVQEQANSMQTDENSSRVRFMLDMLMAIKNNNTSKISNYDPELGERVKKILKQLIRKGNYSTELNIPFQDLVNVEKHGRWWIVGSAWSGKTSQADSGKPISEETQMQSQQQRTEYSQKLLELAKKQRMNTDVRRNIFCILMSAEDYLDAFEKLVKLKLKGMVEREITNVLVHCALQEKTFNPYYMYLANKFCTFDRKYQMMLQCSLWDRIKELKNAKPVQVTNLAKFVGNLVLEKGLPISILKVIEFSDLDKPTMKFMRQVLLTILMSDDSHAIAGVFKRIADSPKLKLFRESLRLFLRHFVLKNAAKNVDEKKASRLADAVRLAEQTLDSSDVSVIF